MIARANRKAHKAGARVLFEVAVAENLPFQDWWFDGVLSRLMLQHLPRRLGNGAPGRSEEF
jgi:ubiquinone/menaquinone biosynthesis C-methylase UbiE